MGGPAPSVQYAWDGPGSLAGGDDGKALCWNQSTGRFAMVAKAAASHTHAPSDLSQGGASSGQVLAWNGSAWVATTISGGVTDHGALTGLGDDDHSIYPLLAGRSGGQTLVGGTGSGQNLTLQSTSNATKGRILAHPITVTQNATSDKCLTLQLMSGGAAPFIECLHNNGATLISLNHVGQVSCAGFLASGVGLDVTLGSGGDLRLRGGASQNMAVFSHAGGGYVTNFGTKRIEWDPTGIGFFATAPVAKQSITGSRGGNAALADLLTKLAATGLITDSTSA